MGYLKYCIVLLATTAFSQYSPKSIELDVSDFYNENKELNILSTDKENFGCNSLLLASVTKQEYILSLATICVHKKQYILGCSEINVPQPIAYSQTVCNRSTVRDLYAEGTALKWYADGSKTPLSNTDWLYTGTYFVTQMIGNCESKPVRVEIRVKEPTPIPIGMSVQTFTDRQTLNDLSNIIGQELVWYKNTNMERVDSSDLIEDNEKYAVFQKIDGCVSRGYLAVDTYRVKRSKTPFDNFRYSINDEILTVINSNDLQSVTILNIFNEVVLNKQCKAKTVEVDLSTVNSGKYVLWVECNGDRKYVAFDKA